jgi:hypothetical protein
MRWKELAIYLGCLLVGFTVFYFYLKIIFSILLGGN